MNDEARFFVYKNYKVINVVYFFLIGIYHLLHDLPNNCSEENSSFLIVNDAC